MKKLKNGQDKNCGLNLISELEGAFAQTSSRQLPQLAHTDITNVTSFEIGALVVHWS